ncbi:hypothetical protein [Rhodococcus sp. WAY2]|uniref:hypothetical protein n=1 Tax=Rhodococcus sp. WAY2 TaxID=2663121 RepID=UPI00131FFBFB|nr:hypothetical protein [Rhodococcus sp. WAY2]QHE73299.1 hypothetical protein GFS60_06954 [Rhodococcus sp. WAY2]
MSNVDLPVPGELANVPAELMAHLRTMRQSIERDFQINDRDASFARLAVMTLQGATPGSIRGHIQHLRDLGVTTEEIWGVIYSIIGHIGMPMFIKALPVLEAEIGLPRWAPHGADSRERPLDR